MNTNPSGDKEKKFLVIFAALLALFLGALDALIISAAMPTIVSDLGRLDLYAWVYSAYFLARAISLPIIGKLSDIYSSKSIFLASTTCFLFASVAAGAAPSMLFLIVARVFQGIGAGGIFALVYIVLSDISSPADRGKTLSLASSVWAISSILGPTLGGIIVTYFSWRWIFYINAPLALLSLAGIACSFQSERSSREQVQLDYFGSVFLSGLILCFLSIFIVGGRNHMWSSPLVLLLLFLSLCFASGFYVAEKRAKDPVINFQFFTRQNFTFGNFTTFLSSCSIFSLFAYMPLFIQGALGKTPLEVGGAMLALSLGWSCGSLVLGRLISGLTVKKHAISGSLLLVCSSLTMLFFSTDTSIITCWLVLFCAGIGMGYVSLSSLLIVQNSLGDKDIGVATSLNQFARTLGGAIGVGICGGIVTAGLLNILEDSTILLGPEAMAQLLESLENIFKPEFQAQLSEHARSALSSAIAQSMKSVYWLSLLTSSACLICTFVLKADESSA